MAETNEAIRGLRAPCKIACIANRPEQGSLVNSTT